MAEERCKMVEQRRREEEVARLGGGIGLWWEGLGWRGGAGMVEERSEEGLEESN